MDRQDNPNQVTENQNWPMPKYGYSGPEKFRPLSPWAYFGYTVLFLIPVVGLIFLIIFSFSSSNINRRSFARSYWIGIVITIILGVVLSIAGITALVASGVDMNQLNDVVYQLNNLNVTVHSM